MKKYVIFGNAESVHVVKWVKELIKYFNVFVISSKNTHDDIKSIVPEANIYNLNLPVSDSGGNTILLKYYFKIKKQIRQIDPDFVNPHYITSHGLLMALIKKYSNFRFKLVQSAWGTDILVTPFKNKFYYHITKFCLDRADLATSDSEYMTGVIKNISNVKTSTFIFGLDELPEVSIEKKNPNIYYSNRILSGNYNVNEVIIFFNRISKVNPDAKLIVSHDGEQRNELESLVKSLGLEKKVSFEGFVSLADQIQLYKQAQFYISIPTSDSTSVSLIEAMAYGCIPIVSDIPANREWIVDGENGLFYNKKTGLSEIEKILKNKEKIFAENRKIVRERAIFPESIKQFVNTINNF